MQLKAEINNDVALQGVVVGVLCADRCSVLKERAEIKDRMNYEHSDFKITA